MSSTPGKGCHLGMESGVIRQCDQLKEAKKSGIIMRNYNRKGFVEEVVLSIPTEVQSTLKCRKY